MVGIPKNAQLFINDIQHLLMIYTRYMSYQTTTAVNKVWVITTMKLNINDTFYSQVLYFSVIIGVPPFISVKATNYAMIYAT